MGFEELLRRRRGERWKPPKRLLALDPGEALGWALFVDGTLAACGQVSTRRAPAKALAELFATQPTEVVCEDYRVYNHRLREHSWSKLFTAKLVGGIQLKCAELDVPLTMQMASTAKGFCSDDKLKKWGLYQVGKRHANDAIRHAVYYLLFHKG